ncbi:MAG: hypothetical protein ACKVIO_04075, partial [Phycisphaerales bacterium]
KSQAQQVPEEIKPVIEYVLLKLQERIGNTSNSNDSEEIIKVNLVEKKPSKELTAQQLAEATEFLASFEDKSLGELIQVEGALHMAAMRVEGDDKAVLDYILAKLTILIAELEN